MIDFEVFVNALSEGTPWAILIAGIGAIWQLVYTYTRDKSTDRQARLQLELETAKFENQRTLEQKRFEHERALETLRFEYEQRKWREQLALELALKHVDARLAEYPQLWNEVRAVAKHNVKTETLTTELAKQSATAIEAWRYSKGGLIAEETTRNAAVALQTALWNYKSSTQDFERVRQARRLLRAALRADLGLGEDALGQSIFDATAARHHIAEELGKLQIELGIVRVERSARSTI